MCCNQPGCLCATNGHRLHVKGCIDGASGGHIRFRVQGTSTYYPSTAGALVDDNGCYVADGTYVALQYTSNTIVAQYKEDAPGATWGPVGTFKVRNNPGYCSSVCFSRGATLLSGVVTDAEGNPIPGPQEIAFDGVRTWTEEDGTFTISLLPGRYGVTMGDKGVGLLEVNEEETASVVVPEPPPVTIRIVPPGS